MPYRTKPATLVTASDLKNTPSRVLAGSLASRSPLNEEHVGIRLLSPFRTVLGVTDDRDPMLL